MNGRILVRRRNPDREEPPPIFRKSALALALAAADTKLEKTSLSVGASDVSYRLGAALLLKYASLEIHKN